jgi:hypothetical protein
VRDEEFLVVYEGVFEYVGCKAEEKCIVKPTFPSSKRTFMIGVADRADIAGVSATLSNRARATFCMPPRFLILMKTRTSGPLNNDQSRPALAPVSVQRSARIQNSRIPDRYASGSSPSWLIAQHRPWDTAPIFNHHGCYIDGGELVQQHPSARGFQWRP